MEETLQTAKTKLGLKPKNVRPMMIAISSKNARLKVGKEKL